MRLFSFFFFFFFQIWHQSWQLALHKVHMEKQRNAFFRKKHLNSSSLRKTKLLIPKINFIQNISSFLEPQFWTKVIPAFSPNQELRDIVLFVQICYPERLLKEGGEWSFFRDSWEACNTLMSAVPWIQRNTWCRLSGRSTSLIIIKNNKLPWLDIAGMVGEHYYF